MLYTEAHSDQSSNKKQYMPIGASDNLSDEQANEVIEFYEMFKEQQKDEKRRIANHTLKNAANIIEGLIESLEEDDVSVSDVYLRFNNSTSITALLMVDESTFLSDEFDTAYNKAMKLESDSETEIFDIHFTFAAATESLREDIVACQGFKLKRSNSKDEHS